MKGKERMKREEMKNVRNRRKFCH